MSSEPPWWRIYVIEIVYGPPLRAPVDDSVLNQLLDALFSGHVLHDPVQRYYQAAVEGLRSGAPLRVHDYQDEDAVRDLLERMVHALDQRRPWPEPSYRPLSVNDVWADLRDNAAIGRIPMSERDIEKHFNLPFTTTGHSLRHPEQVMAFRLRTGQIVALRAKQRRDDYVELYAAANPAATRDAFRDFTGLHVYTPDRNTETRRSLVSRHRASTQNAKHASGSSSPTTDESSSGC